MSKATYPLKLPTSLKKEAARLAKQDGVSLNQWIATAVAQKIGVVETTAEFLKRRAGNASGSGLSEILRHAPDRAPDPGDELPPDWASS
ncbi:toxin-antitoxin system HicB family antitoxin [Methylosinus sp. Sm6]|jgi:hypothetical protein|uniref:toxin-antitoxin system HicB family antitoxin n=1 Tax=Methylosinus sp. Sm6 TaxID=2866948 RepID=UPI001C99AB62|nr:toxin-antitoxin system HicB family antitoxin [Methylosinus sp. Sm6]MBY6240439.1 type II toxin-antitoxin system HicB family antitoxin [Methylosinus sp. Sm6]